MEIFCNRERPNYEEIVSYGPRWLTEYREMDANYKYAGWTLDLMAYWLERIINNEFPAYADEKTIGMWERVLRIERDPAMSLEERRRIVEAYLAGPGKMSRSTIKALVKAYTGQDCDVYWVDETLRIRFDNTEGIPVSISTLLGILRRRMPAHISYQVQCMCMVRVFISADRERWKESYAISGTFPYASANLVIIDTEVDAQAFGLKRRMNFKMPGNFEMTGQYPTTSKKLEIAGSMIETAAQAEGYHVLYPNTDKEFRDGTYPKAASSASYADPLIEADVKATGCKYQNVSAGSVPYTDTGLSLERANTEIEPSGTGIEVIYTAAGEGETGVIPVPSNGLEESGDTVIPGVRTEKYQVRYKLCGNTLEI